MARGTVLPPCTDTHALVEAIARLCEDPHPEKDGWRARCPNHNGTSNTSLSIDPGEDRALLTCFAGCQTDDVVHAIGLTMADLHLKTTERPAQPWRIVAVYDYYDQDGTLVHQTIRYVPKAFRQRRPDPIEPGQFIWNLQNIQPVLYHLPEVLQGIADGHTIYVVEGEKDADTLMAKGLIATCNPMGAKKWHKRYTAMLQGASVVILPHYDTPGWEHADKVAHALLGTAATIKIVKDFHTEAPGSDITDWIDAGGDRETFDTLIEHAEAYTAPGMITETTPPLGTPLNLNGTSPAEPAASSSMPESGRVIQQYKHLLPQVVAQAEEALLGMPHAPQVFQRARTLVAVAPAEKTAQGITRSLGTPIISPLSAPRLRAFLAQAAAWWSPNVTQKQLLPDMPRDWVVETLLDKQEWSFPPLTGIVTSPTFRANGSLILTQGYDADTGLWLSWAQDTFPTLPESPTKEDAAQALLALQEPFENFPFAEPYHFSAALAAVLTIVARFAMQNVPLFAIRATTRGSGKTLLADCIAMIATGRPAPKMPQVKEEEEERKRLLALALDGDPLVVIDNVSGALGNPALDLAITSQLFKDRLLGKNATKEAPLYTVFLATGNNMFFKGDMARRAIPIDLVPDVERPETRNGFAHPRLLDWIYGERPRLLSAALTILRAYWVAGKPRQPIEPYGSFETWSDLVRSALVWLGAEDPCTGRQELEASSDETFEAHAELLGAWYGRYQSAPVTLARIIGDLQFHCTPATAVTQDRTGSDDKLPSKVIETPAEKARREEEATFQHEEMLAWISLSDTLTFFDSKFDGRRLHAKPLGIALKRLCGRVINGKRLKQLALRNEKGVQWQVETVIPKPFSQSVSPVSHVSNVSKLHPYAKTSDEIVNVKHKEKNKHLRIEWETLTEDTLLTGGSTGMVESEADDEGLSDEPGSDFADVPF